MNTITIDNLHALGRELYGDDTKQWRFRCPRCKTEQSAQDFIENNIADADKYIGFSCIGRFVEGKGCDWTLGGFFQIHDLEVLFPDGEKRPAFEFADVSRDLQKKYYVEVAG